MNQKRDDDILFLVYSNSLLSLLNGRLHLGYQTADPFMITLSTFRQSSRNRSAQVQFSVSRRHPEAYLKKQDG
jgi:transcriptional regulator of nitric oxide reductase